MEQADRRKNMLKKRIFMSKYSSTCKWRVSLCSMTLLCDHDVWALLGNICYLDGLQLA